VGLLLDAKLRRLTNGTRSLDDLMRLAYLRFSGKRGYTPAEFCAAASEVGGADLRDFFRQALETTGELDYQEMLDWYGLRFSPAADSTTKAWLGLETETREGRLVITGLLRDTPAYHSGMTTEDELVAIDAFRLGPDGLEAALDRYRPGDRVTLLVSRQGALRRFDVRLGRAPVDRWSLSIRPEATPEQRQRLAAWLGEE
jgi:predicted metalloprotease with PDZ domain